MKKNRLLNHAGMTLIVVGLLLLAGCQADAGASEAAAPSAEPDGLTGSWIINPTIESGGGAGLTFASLFTFA